MKAQIITIGNELLIGQVVDTNSAWMGVELNAIGVDVVQITAIADREDDILLALAHASERADVILVTGGLGPTKDDVTKHALCRYFQCGLRRDPDVLAHVEKLLSRFDRPLLEVNRAQADVLDVADILFNALGTAPGMWIEHQNKRYVLMPGVPHEMQQMMHDQVLPRLQLSDGQQAIWHHTLLTAGIGESFLAEKIAAIESDLPENMQLAYLPKPGSVRLRLSATGQDQKILRQETAKYAGQIRRAIGPYFVTDGDRTLEEVVVFCLREMGQTVSTAESCTGGYIAHLITTVPGSSAVFPGGSVAYSNHIKHATLGVPEEILRDHGAVSEATVVAMAVGARQLFATDYAISVSGVAGPGGGSVEKPVGFVWIAVAAPNGVVRARSFQFGTGRKLNIERAAHAALYELFRMLGESRH